MDTELVLELPNDLRTIEHAVEYVMQRCAGHDEHARKLRLNFRVGLSEALANAMLYGNADDPRRKVRVEVTLGEGELTAKIRDEGQGFDPEAVPDPTAPGNVKKTGGRGLFLMRKLMDEVHYNEEGNEVTLVLHLDESEEDRKRKAELEQAVTEEVLSGMWIDDDEDDDAKGGDG
ncbi:MAG: ATP-binding protein [Gemmatimonadetes bacterium]|nr:ATP-binding protein [Gemmatimonadota bacterium]